MSSVHTTNKIDWWMIILHGVRLEFIQDYTLKSLRLKPDKWNKLIISDEQRTFITNFIERGTVQTTTFDNTVLWSLVNWSRIVHVLNAFSYVSSWNTKVFSIYNLYMEIDFFFAFCHYNGRSSSIHCFQIWPTKPFMTILQTIV